MKFVHAAAKVTRAAVTGIAQSSAAATACKIVGYGVAYYWLVLIPPILLVVNEIQANPESDTTELGWTMVGWWYAGTAIFVAVCFALNRWGNSKQDLASRERLAAALERNTAALERLASNDKPAE